MASSDKVPEKTDKFKCENWESYIKNNNIKKTELYAGFLNEIDIQENDVWAYYEENIGFIDNCFCCLKCGRILTSSSVTRHFTISQELHDHYTQLNKPNGNPSSTKQSNKKQNSQNKMKLKRKNQNATYSFDGTPTYNCQSTKVTTNNEFSSQHITNLNCKRKQHEQGATSLNGSLLDSFVDDECSLQCKSLKTNGKKCRTSNYRKRKKKRKKDDSLGVNKNLGFDWYEADDLTAKTANSKPPISPALRLVGSVNNKNYQELYNSTSYDEHQSSTTKSNDSPLDSSVQNKNEFNVHVITENCFKDVANSGESFDDSSSLPLELRTLRNAVIGVETLNCNFLFETTDTEFETVDSRSNIEKYSDNLGEYVRFESDQSSMSDLSDSAFDVPCDSCKEPNSLCNTSFYSLKQIPHVIYSGIPSSSSNLQTIGTPYSENAKPYNVDFSDHGYDSLRRAITEVVVHTQQRQVEQINLSEQGSSSKKEIFS